MDAILKGRWILLVEDQPLVVLDIADALKRAGASVLSAVTLQDGLRLAENPHLSAAIVDYAMREGDTAVLCTRLTERGLPFIVYTGYDKVSDACRAGVIVAKPAAPDILLSALAQILRR